MIRHISVMGLLLGAFVLVVEATPASAWSAPQVGPACAGLRGAGPQVTRVAGNFLGGRFVGRGPLSSTAVDYKSFQNCFASVDACRAWVDGKARAFPLSPGYGRCTPVVLR